MRTARRWIGSALGIVLALCVAAVWIYVNPYAVLEGGRLRREVFKVRRYTPDHPGIRALPGT